ncbi:glycosyltransferase family 4 protein [Francisella hispaniensis]|uniref:Glycosyl transferase family 1 domain-containing protein n=1 Tax=Francisella hispaniensis TaxID=622488 RepID=F4BH46_9GAMM|nr:glycosyltransferase family 4 protein [Francisella hispaniensis]AEE26790.1 hypothetical protein FN3523_1487 [Francisella hispaniensis]
MKKILIFIGAYLPGFNGGGPIKSISNLVKLLKSNFDIYIYTKDRDIGATRPYDSVEINKWNNLNGVKIYYANRQALGFRHICKVISEISPDTIYLNSFFSIDFSFKLLMLKRLSSISKETKIVLAPRGEFAHLKYKKFKKNIYIAIYKLIGLHRTINTWHLTSDFELVDVKKVFPVIDDYQVISNISDIDRFEDIKIITHDKPVLSYISRITKPKGLDLVLDMIKDVYFELEFNICGNPEDAMFWSKCKNKISQLPSNIKVNCLGGVGESEINNILSKTDVFISITYGENYGHSIAEAILAGAYVLISDRTPWRNLSTIGIGEDICISNMKKFRLLLQEQLNKPSKLRYAERLFRRDISRKYIMQSLEHNKNLYISLF